MATKKVKMISGDTPSVPSVKLTFRKAKVKSKYANQKPICDFIMFAVYIQSKFS